MTMLATMTKLFAKQLSHHIHLRQHFHPTQLLTLRNFYDGNFETISITNKIVICKRHYLYDNIHTSRIYNSVYVAILYCIRLR